MFHHLTTFQGYCVVQRPHQSDQYIPEGKSRRVSIYKYKYYNHAWMIKKRIRKKVLLSVFFSLLIEEEEE
jgi:hypothetical protein